MVSVAIIGLAPEDISIGASKEIKMEEYACIRSETMATSVRSRLKWDESGI